MVLIKQLKIGNVVRHVESGNAYEVVAVDESGRVFAVREIEISNPDEWTLIEPPPGKMNRRAKLAQIIVQAIEEFPKVYKFLTGGDTGCHPQHLVDAIADRILAEQESASLRENILTGVAAELKAMLTEAQEENERLRAIEAAVKVYLIAGSIPIAKRAYTELWRASGLDREKFLKGEPQ